MEIRQVGSQGLMASCQGLGCMGMSAFYSTHPVEEAESIAVIRKALDSGVNFLDTAEVYGPHTNEALVGKSIKGRPRESIIVATKMGIQIQDRQMILDSSPAAVRASCLASLQRLGVDYIDLYYQHRVDPKTPIEDTMHALKALKEEGKIRFIGLSEVDAVQLRRAHAVHPVTAVQMEYSLWTREIEGEFLDTCRELGVAVVAYSPLGRGFLTGTIKSVDDLAPDDWRRAENPRFAKESIRKNLEYVEKLKGIATRKGITPAQLALAWVHGQGGDIFPIPGTKREKYLMENMAAASIRLTKEELEEVGAAVDWKAVSGSRY